ncbi:MAG: FKBP-type peptidyl-prolyl cis-trans isomerase [Acidobacteriota bacterium]
MKILFALPLVLFSLAGRADEQPLPPSDLTQPPPTAERQANGLITRQLSPGSGTEQPAATDILKLRYTVWKNDGTLVTRTPGDNAAMIPVPNMLPGWREAAMKMSEGGKQRAWIPSELGGGKIPDGETFVIDTELVEIIHPPVTPPDVAGPPEDALVTESGLSYRILRPGTGSQHPKRHDRVVVHYSGWTTDGSLFDTSITRGEPAEFDLRNVIPGWTEGLQLITAGGRIRLWVPARLAYKNERGKPQGMLVFDIELIAIR